MDEEFEKVFKEVEALPPLDRATNLTLMFLGESILLLLNSGDITRLTGFKASVLKLFDEASKAVMNKSANAN